MSSILCCYREPWTIKATGKTPIKSSHSCLTCFNENSNWYVDENINKYITEDPGSLDSLKATFDFWESNLKATINGYVFGNVPGLTMYSGDEVVWYLLQVGGFTEMHTVHFHGQSVLYVSNHVFYD